MSNITLFQHIFICFCYHLSLQLKWSNVSAITCHFSVMSFSLWLIDHISCQAINCYTKAHNIKPCHPVILSNRCAAYLRWSLDSNLYAICAACMRHLNLMNTYSNHIFTLLTVICLNCYQDLPIPGTKKFIRFRKYTIEWAWSYNTCWSMSLLFLFLFCFCFCSGERILFQLQYYMTSTYTIAACL